MHDDSKKERIIKEISNLTEEAEKFQENLDAYCEFIKGFMLNTSGLN